MPLYEPPNMTGGIDDTLVETAIAVPTLIPGLLIFVFGVIFLGGMASQKRRTGYADVSMWALLASLTTFVLSLLLTIKSGLITLEVLSVVVAVTIFSGLWFFLSKGRGEF